MRVLLDTNIVLRLVNPAKAPSQALAESAVQRLHARGHIPCLFPQNLYEFWAVATRPMDANGLGLSTSGAREEVDSLLSLFLMLHDERAIFSRWLELVTDHNVQGKPAHDARLVAAMLGHGITRVLTFNDTDFSRFEEIEVLTPESVESGPPL